jgi:hypothetical protein
MLCSVILTKPCAEDALQQALSRAMTLLAQTFYDDLTARGRTLRISINRWLTLGLFTIIRENPRLSRVYVIIRRFIKTATERELRAMKKLVHLGVGVLALAMIVGKVSTQQTEFCANEAPAKVALYQKFLANYK